MWEHRRDGKNDCVVGRGQVRSRRPRGLALSPPLARQRASFPESPCFPSQWSDPVGSAPSPGHDSAGRALLSHGHEVCHSGQGSGRSCFGGLLLGPCPVSACSLWPAECVLRCGKGGWRAGQAEQSRRRPHHCGRLCWPEAKRHLGFSEGVWRPGDATASAGGAFATRLHGRRASCDSGLIPKTYQHTFSSSFIFTNSPFLYFPDFCLNTMCVQISAHVYLQLSEIWASQTTVVTEKHTGDRIRGQHSRIQGLWKHKMRVNVLQERRALA